MLAGTIIVASDKGAEQMMKSRLEIATIDGWRTMATAPTSEHEPFLILRPKNDVAVFVVEQVSMFQGHYYRDFANGLIDYKDKITDGIAWLPMSALPPFPLTQ